MRLLYVIDMMSQNTVLVGNKEFIMEDKRLYPNHNFGYFSIYCDNYVDCTCIGVHFEDINTKPLFFFNCSFYGCTFGTNPLFIFEACTFESCDFKGTFEATLSACYFIDDTHVPYMPMVCPAEGEFIGWKVCRGQNNHTPYLVKLRIPYGVKRTSSFGSRKCRCECALVLDILHIDGTPAKETTVFSHYDKTFSYTKGQWVRVDCYNNDRRFVCSSGIHFFVERQEAINYYESELI